MFVNGNVISHCSSCCFLIVIDEKLSSFVFFQVVSVQQNYVRPALEDIGENILTEECRIQTGLDEDAIRNAQPLEQVLDEVSSDLSVLLNECCN